MMGEQWKSGLPFSLICRAEKGEGAGDGWACPTSPTIFHPPKVGEKEERK